MSTRSQNEMIEDIVTILIVVFVLTLPLLVWRAMWLWNVLGEGQPA